jgi:hypothetical protein
LEDILRTLEGSEHPVAVHLQLPAVRLRQPLERVWRLRPVPSRQGRLSWIYESP